MLTEATTVDAYGIFQGGGAKGYAHIGALKAAEGRGIRFIRIAGTSAGAIIATLAAAGYAADELLDPTKPFGERGVLDVDVGEIVDAAEYGRVKRLQERYAAIGGIPKARSGLIGHWQREKRRSKPLLILRAIKATILEAGTLTHVYRNFGAVGTNPVIEWLDGLLRAKVGGTRPVTFGDLGMRLRMVAANVTSGQLHRFGFPGDDELPVAASAVASACFPFFFKPVVREEEIFVDGGLVSNLPVWLFDDERDDDVSFLPTFGFRLVNDALVAKAKTAPAYFFPYGIRMFQTLSSGARALEERRIDYYHGIDLQAHIGTLSFEAARAEAPTLVNQAKNCVEEYFAQEVGPQDPERMNRVLALLVETLTEHYGWYGGPVRAHVLLPDADGHHARTIYCYNMDRDADDHLRVRTDVDGVGAVFRLREPVYISPRPLKEIGPGALKYEISARPPTVAGLYATPMFEDVSEWAKPNPGDRSRPFAALVIDRDEDFAPIVIDAAEQDAFANLAAIIGEEIRDRRFVLAERGSEVVVRGADWDPALSVPGFRVAARKIRDAGNGELGGLVSSALLRLRARLPTS